MLCLKRKAKLTCALLASARKTERGQRTWHVQTLLVRQPGDLRTGLVSKIAQVRIGKARRQSR